MFTLLCLAAMTSTLSDEVKVAYAKPEFLVEAADAKADASTIFDVRAKDKYEAGHIPGAVNLSIAPWSKAINDGNANAAYWKQELATVGIGPKAAVLVYSDDVRDMCRAWWMLKLAGVPDVRVLNGGWNAYAGAKLTISKDPTLAKLAEVHDWKPEARLMTKAEVVKLAEAKSPGVLDARAKEEYSAGRVPGATLLEWSDVLDAKTKKFKAAPELIKLFDEKKVDLTKPCVTYCQGGGRASVLAFGLELMGAKNVKNYYKSWGEYGTDKGTPKEKE